MIFYPANLRFAPALELLSALQEPLLQVRRTPKRFLSGSVIPLRKFDHFSQDALCLDQDIYRLWGAQLEYWKANNELSVAPRSLEKHRDIEPSMCSPPKGMAARLDFLKDAAQNVEPDRCSNALPQRLISLAPRRLPRGAPHCGQDRNDREDGLHPRGELFVALHPCKQWSPANDGSNSDCCTVHVPNKSNPFIAQSMSRSNSICVCRITRATSSR